jgi:Flp pilus assembly protein TadD
MEQKAYALAVKAREALPKDAEVAKALGIISYRRGDFPGALRLLNQGIQYGLKDGKTFYYLGLAESQLKHTKEARSALQQALTMNLPGPLVEDAKRALAQIK